MSDDTWWAFVAGIDRDALILELPGSKLDRRMREQHAVKVAEFYGARSASEQITPGEFRRALMFARKRRLAEMEVAEMRAARTNYLRRKAS